MGLVAQLKELPCQAATLRGKLREKRTWLAICLQLAMWWCGWALFQVGRGFHMRKLALEYARNGELTDGIIDDYYFFRAINKPNPREALMKETIFAYNQYCSVMLVPEEYSYVL